MKRKILVMAFAALFSGAAFAAGNTGGNAGGTQGERVMPSVGGEAPVAKHQGRDTQEIKRKFDQLDKNHDNKLSYDEAQADPSLAKYWKAQGMSQQRQMSESDFAQFESREATGTNIYESGKGLPATPHQKKATGQGTTEGPGASKSGQGAGGNQ